MAASHKNVSILTDPEESRAVIVENGEPLTPVLMAQRDLRVDAKEMADYVLRLHDYLLAVNPTQPATLAGSDFPALVRQVENHLIAASRAAMSMRLTSRFDEDFLTAAFKGRLLDFTIAASALKEAHDVSPHKLACALDDIAWENNAAQEGEKIGWDDFSKTVRQLTPSGILTQPAMNGGKVWVFYGVERDSHLYTESVKMALDQIVGPWWASAKQQNPIPAPPVFTHTQIAAMPPMSHAFAVEAIELLAKFEQNARDHGTTLEKQIGSERQWRWLAQFAWDQPRFSQAIFDACKNSRPETINFARQDEPVRTPAPLLPDDPAQSANRARRS